MDKSNGRDNVHEAFTVQRRRGHAPWHPPVHFGAGIRARGRMLRRRDVLSAASAPTGNRQEIATFAFAVA